LQRYIAEEIATDHVDGLLSRRETMRRLALLGVSAASATALIAACSNERAAAPTSTSTSGSTSATTAATTSAAAAGPAPGMAPGMGDALSTTEITWAGPRGELKGSWAEAAAPKGAVLVIHENKGLNDWVRTVAGRLAGIGYSALAIDLLSEEGGTATFTDPAEATAALGKIDPARFVADLKSGVDEVGKRAPGKKLAVMGFCFGGGLTWQLLAAGGEPQLAAAVPFYGPLPDGADFTGAKAAVLGFYGALDTRVTSTKDAADAALKKAGLDYMLVVEPNADHAFFNDSGPRYNADAAADAWQKVQDWFGKNLV
jgi:carboxymethylenebutenolidase